MDLQLLEYGNQTLATPWLDWLMVTATVGGLACLPAVGIYFLRRKQLRLGRGILWALLGSMVATLLFYYLAMRPRPTHVRLLLPTPIFPSFPSGHAAAAFATATIVTLAQQPRRWLMVVVAFAGASLIALSRVYLGHHYPTDILGGAVLGAALGAGCYGIFVVEEGTALQRLRWLLWPQVAIIFIVTEMAYLGFLPGYLLHWPYADKVLHFLLFGAVVFWLNLWLVGKKVDVGWSGGRDTIVGEGASIPAPQSLFSLPLAILIPFPLALAEECFQYFSPLRTTSVLDLAADLAGMVCFWWLSQQLLARNGLFAPHSLDRQ